ncbi:MAG: hypothetical protein U0X71_02115 [Sphingobacteriaceae bacterium]
MRKRHWKVFKDKLSAKRESSAASTAYLGTELYISPSGYPVKVPDAQIKQFMYDAGKINKTYPNGALYGYKNANDVLFLAKIEKGKFLGYENQHTKELYIDTTTYRDKVKVFILEELNDGCQYKQYTISYTVPAKTSQVINSLNLSGLTKDNLQQRDRCSNAPDIRAKPDPVSGPKHLALFVNGYRFGFRRSRTRIMRSLVPIDIIIGKGWISSLANNWGLVRDYMLMDIMVLVRRIIKICCSSIIVPRVR